MNGDRTEISSDREINVKFYLIWFISSDLKTILMQKEGLKKKKSISDFICIDPLILSANASESLL